MSTTASENTAQNAPQSTVSDKGERVVLTDVEQILFNEVSTRINAHNADVAQLNAIGGNIDSLVENLAKHSDDPAVAELREKANKLYLAQKELEDKIAAIVKPVAEQMQKDKAGEVEKLETSISKLSKEVKGMFPVLQNFPNVLKVLPSLARVDKGKTTRASSGAPDGRRIRGFLVSVNGELATILSNNKQMSNLSAAAVKIARPEINTQTLQDAFFAVVGTETKPTDYPAEVDFTVNAADGTPFAIHMVKSDKPRTNEVNSETPTE